MSALLPALLCPCDYNSECQLHDHQHNIISINSQLQCNYTHQHKHTNKVKQFNKQYKNVKLSQLPSSTSQVLHTVVHQLSVLTSTINELGNRLDNVEYKLMSSSVK